MCVQPNASTAPPPQSAVGNCSTGVVNGGVLSTGTLDHFFISPQVMMQLGPSHNLSGGWQQPKRPQPARGRVLLWNHVTLISPIGSSGNFAFPQDIVVCHALAEVLAQSRWARVRRFSHSDGEDGEDASPIGFIFCSALQICWWSISQWH